MHLKKKKELKEKKKKIEDQNKELDRQKNELQRQNNELINEINRIKEFNKKLLKIVYEKKLKNFIKGKIENYKNTNEFKNIKIEDEKNDVLIKEITEEENYKKKSSKTLENKILSKSEKLKLIEHLNIILVGSSGVGKSTLINAFLELDKENSLETGIGEPCTKDIKYFESNKVPFFRLADSRGFEKEEKYGIKELTNSISNFINDKIESGDSDKFVHCIWFCITGSRLEKCERECLKKLSELYQLNSIPIIVVYTKALNEEEINGMEKFIKEKFKSCDFIPVLAKKAKIFNYIIEPIGLDKLKEKSILRAKEAVKSSCYEFYFKETEKEIKNSIANDIDAINSTLSNSLKEKLEIMKEGKSEEEISDDLKNLLTNLISLNINFENRTYLSNKNNELIREFSEKFIKESYQKFNDFFNEEYCEKENTNILQEVNTNFYNIFNNDFCTYNEFLDYSKLSDDEIKKNINKSLEKNLRPNILLCYLKKCIENIFNHCQTKFKEFSKKTFENILREDKDFKSFILKIAQKEFDKMNDKIQMK